MKVGNTVKLTNEAKKAFRSRITSSKNTATIIKLKKRIGSNDLVYLSHSLISKDTSYPTIDISWIQLTTSTLSFSKICKEY